jgi:hypothetical protein
MIDRFLRSITTDHLARGVFHQHSRIDPSDRGIHRHAPPQSQALRLDRQGEQKVIRANRRLNSKNNEALH